MEVDKQKIEQAARKVLGGLDPELVGYDPEFPEIMCQVAELAGYDPEKDFWAEEDDYMDTPIFHAVEDITWSIAQELGIEDLL